MQTAGRAAAAALDGGPGAAAASAARTGAEFAARPSTVYYANTRDAVRQVGVGEAAAIHNGGDPFLRVVVVLVEVVAGGGGSIRRTPPAPLAVVAAAAVFTLARPTQIMVYEGIAGLYRGYGATLASFGPFSALYFVFYERVRGWAGIRTASLIPFLKSLS